MMKQQSPFSVQFCQRPEKSSRELVAGRDFRLDVYSVLKFFHLVPSMRLIDLLRVGMSVYVIDRLVRRKQRINGYRWHRSLQAQIGVLDADFWLTEEVQEALTACVDFVSGDSWEFSFREDRNSARITDEQFLPLPDPFANDKPLVCLYSGGLDSAAGLGCRIADCPGRPIVPVTVWHQPLQRKLMYEQQYPLLKSRFGVLLTPLVAKAAMIWSPELRKVKEERSQRSRSFLFAALGAVAAAMTGTSTIEVYESGIGAINLPLMCGMLGSKATRSCHPEFFRRMSRLCTLVAGREISFQLPFNGMTKGQVVRRLADTNLADLALSTVSCVHYPLRESAHKQCGVCPACLFRRQAMFIAGIEEPKGTYKCDLFGAKKRATRVAKNQVQYLKAFLMQVVQLGDLKNDGRLLRRFRRHLIGTEIVRSDEALEPTIDLLLKYRHEWLELAAVGERRGWSWTKLLGPTGSSQNGGVSHASA